MASKSKKRRGRYVDDPRSEGETDEECRLRRIGALGDDDAMPQFFSSNPVIRQFVESHGGDFIRERKQLLFKDGARLEDHGSLGYGNLHEPPSDEHERAKLRVRYCKQKCEVAESKFRDYRKLLLGLGDGRIFESTHEEQEAKLKKLKACATKARQSLQKARQEVTDTEPAWIAAKRKIDAERQQENATFRERIKNVKL